MLAIADRPRERLLAYGGELVTVEELIAILLGTGTARHSAVEIAAALVAHCGGLIQLSRASPHELARVPGVGGARAARLAAAFHLGRRAMRARFAGADTMDNAADVFARLEPRLSGLAQEVFVALALDVRNAVIEEIEVARGSLTHVGVHPREVFRPLIRAAAAAVIVAHNHPSGDPRPSPADIDLTDRLRKVGELVEIPLLDHVILGHHDYWSMADRSWG